MTNSAYELSYKWQPGVYLSARRQLIIQGCREAWLQIQRERTMCPASFSIVAVISVSLKGDQTDPAEDDRRTLVQETQYFVEGDKNLRSHFNTYKILIRGQ